MKNKLLYIVFAFVMLRVSAQEYKLFGVSQDGKVLLKWMSKKIVKESAFDVYRQEGGSWQKLNQQPITPSPLILETELKTSKNHFPKDESYEMYVTFSNAKESSANKQAYSDYTLAISSIYDNALAKHRGIYFEDHTAVIGKTYGYKLVDAKTQKEIATLNKLTIGDLGRAPENLEYKQIKQNIEFSWTANEDYIGYNIYRDNNKVNDEPIMANAEKGVLKRVLFKDVQVPVGIHEYFIKGVTFLNTESSASSATKVTVTDAIAPSMVKGLKGARRGAEIVLTWTANKDADLAGYFVYTSADKGTTFTKLTTQLLGISITQYIHKVTANNIGSHQYVIEAVDTNGNANRSMPVSVFVPDNEAPVKPVDLKGISERGKITLSWRGNSEKDLAGYRIYRGLKDDDENEMLLLNVTPQMATTFVDSFYEKAGTKFIYKVAAIDKSFNESEKAMVWVQLPDVIPPSAPFLKEGKVENGQIVLNWEPVRTDAIAGYEVYRLQEDKEVKISRELIIGTTFSEAIKERGVLEYYIKAVDSAKLASTPSNKIAIATANEKLDFAIRLQQEVASKKVVLKLLGVKLDEVAQILVFRKSGASGFTLLPAQFRLDEFKDEQTEENTIYEYFVELILNDDTRIRSKKQSINNTY